jgi:outer membrane protein assembly factor BamB
VASILIHDFSFPAAMSGRWRYRLLASLCLFLGTLAFAAQAEEWPGWRGGIREGRSASPHGPLDLSAERNVVWKTSLPGAGHSSPIVTQDAVYVTTTWNAETDPRVLTVFRSLLWLTLLLIAVPTFGFLLRRCVPEEGSRIGVRVLLGLAGTGLLVILLCGLIFYGEGILNFNRAVERGWIAACLCGTHCLLLSSLYAASSRRAGLVGGLSLLAFASVLALTIPDRAHTVAADPLSDVSKLIYVTIAIPALVGLARLFWRCPDVRRQAGKNGQETSAPRCFLLWRIVQGAVLLLPFLLVAFLLHLAAASGESLDRTISVGTPYAPRLPVWTPILPLLLLALLLLARWRRGDSFWLNSGVVVSALMMALTGLLSGAEQLVVRVPYIAYLLGEITFTPLLGGTALTLFVVACIAAPTALLLHALHRRRLSPPPVLPGIVRVAAVLLIPLYFVYANALSRVPHMERGIVCLDRQSGGIRWFCGGVVAPNSVMHGDNSPATPTPVTDGERIYAYFGTPGLLCADTRGRRLWINRELPYSSREGVASSPILCQGKVLVLSESDAGGYLTAIDGKTGQIAWRTPRDKKRHSFAGNCRTPTVATIAGKEVIVVWGYEDISGYDPATGRALWSHAIEDVGTGGNPVASATTDGSHLFLVGPYEAMCLDMERLAHSDTFLLWRQETDEGAQCSTPVVANGLLFAVSDNGSAYCLEARTGKELWRKELEEQHYASVIAVGDRIYFCGTQGRTTVTAADRTFRLLAQNTLDGQMFATFAPVDGDLFLRTRTHLLCLRERNPAMTIVPGLVSEGRAK